MTDAARAAAETVWRAEAGRIVGGLMRLVRSLDLAEDCAQDALVAALEHWPADGLPQNPGAWLMATAKHRALDRLRAAQLHGRKHEDLAADLDALQAMVVPDFVDALDAARQDDLGDDQLRLFFVACHPLLSADARVALTLRLLGGLSTAEIARACLVPEPTIAQRIVRAKRQLAEARVPFEVPDAAARAPRLASVLEAIYLIFNEGYAATSGAHWQRPALMDEALRLGAVLANAMPIEAEVHGLWALMALQASRRDARSDAQGRPVLLADQDRRRWDHRLIDHGLAALARAQALGAGDAAYTLQAALAACHARAARAEDTDWPGIVALYDRLLALRPSPVVALNRAVAVGMAEGPAAALGLVDALLAEPALARYPWLPSVRGDLLDRLGRAAEAGTEFRRAAALTQNEQERALLLARAHRVASQP
ncbi:MAG: sigma-70 family RNA polymerase sigma factor [Rubrivivax sp.]|nr:sigma-70 family RNA polymerase sigma factor [Rubrivivax sp.]